MKRKLTLVLTLTVLVIISQYVNIQVSFSSRGPREDPEISVNKDVKYGLSVSFTGEKAAFTEDVQLTIFNGGRKTRKINLTDRVFQGKIETLTFKEGPRNSFSEKIGDVLYLEWINLEVKPHSTTVIHYEIDTDFALINAKVTFLVNGEKSKIIHVSGDRYLFVNRSDNLSLLINLSNELPVWVNEVKYYPFQILLSVNIPEDYFMYVKADPEPTLSSSLMGVEVKTWSFTLSNSSEKIKLNLRAKRNASLGFVEVDPIRVVVLPQPKETIQMLENSRENMQKSIDQLNNMSKYLSNFSNILDAETKLLNASLHYINFVSNSLRNLSGGTRNISSALNLTCKGLKNLSNLVGDTVARLRVSTSSIPSNPPFLLHISEIPALPPNFPIPINSSLLNKLKEMFSEVAQEVVDKVNSFITNIWSSFISQVVTPLRRLVLELEFLKKQLNYVSDSVSLLTNATGNVSTALKLLSNQTMNIHDLINESHQVTLHSKEAVDEMVDEINSQISNLTRKKKDLENEIKLLAMNTPLNMPVSIVSVKNGGIHFSIKKISDETWEVKDLQLSEALGLNLTCVSICFDKTSEVKTFVQGEGGEFVEVNPTSLNMYVGNRTITFLPYNSDAGNERTFLKSLTGSEIRIRIKSKEKPKVKAVLDLINGSWLSFEENNEYVVYVRLPKISYGFIPKSLETPNFNLTQEREKVSGFKFERWMWIPLLTIPLIATTLLILREKPPKVVVTDKLISKVDELEKKLKSLRNSRKPVK